MTVNNEFELIEQAFRSRVTRVQAHTKLSNGDDASVHRVPEGYEWVTSVDTSLAGVHWPEDFPLELAADRAVCSALSDIAAMGARASSVWVSVMADNQDMLRAMGDGVAAACHRYEVELAGGDTVKSAQTGISVTVSGLLPHDSAMQRSKAEVGDSLWLAGMLGMSSLSLEQWQLGVRTADNIRYFAHVEPLLAQGETLREQGVRCCIDVSDGLLQDAHHLAQASGVGLEIDLEALPYWDSLSNALGKDKAIRALLAGGEDYALLFTAAADVKGLDTVATKIGRVVASNDVSVMYAGARIPAPSAGYDHFA